MDNKLLNRDIAEILSANTGKSVAAIEQFLTAFSSIVNEGIINDQIVKIKGIGIFKVTMVKERESVHVNTGERIMIPPHHKVSFLPEKNLKELINKPFAAFEAIETSEEENGFMSLTVNEKQDNGMQEFIDSKNQDLDDEEDMQEIGDVSPVSVSAPTVSTHEESTSITPPPVPIFIAAQPTPPPPVPQYTAAQPTPPSVADESQLLPPPISFERRSEPPPVPTYSAAQQTPPPPVSTHNVEQTPPPPPAPVSIEEAPKHSSTSTSHRSHTHSHHRRKRRKKSKRSSTKVLLIILFILLFILIAGAVWYFFFYSKSWDDYASRIGNTIKGGGNIAVMADSTVSKQSVASVNVPSALPDTTKTTAADSLSLRRDSLPSVTTAGQTQPTASSQPSTSSQQTSTARQEPAKPTTTSPQSTTTGQNRSTTSAQQTTTGQERSTTSSQQTSTPRQETTKPSTTTSRQTGTASASNKVLATVKMAPGERLTLLAEKYYGLKVFWVYIYDYNKAKIGSDPNRIPTNMEIQIPAKEVYGIDATSNASIAKASELQTRLVTGIN